MTIMVRCDRCGAEEDQYKDCGFLTVNFYKRDHREVTQHYCPSCAYDLLDKLGVTMTKWEDCDCPVCVEERV